MELLSFVFLNFIVILIMKRKPSQELATPSGNSKQVMKRLKSPLGKRLPIKKPQQISSVILQKHKGTRSREEQIADSNNTTASTKPKTIKPNRKIRNKSFKELDQQEIMNIINSFATKIQRQWRAYAFRKHLLEFMALMKAQRKQEAQIEPSFFSLHNQKIKQVAHFEEEEISSGTTLYDRQKYDSFSSYKQSNHCDHSRAQQSGKSKSQSNIPASKSSIITPRNRPDQIASQIKTLRHTEKINQQLSRSLEKPLSYRQYKQSTIQVRRASFNPLQQRAVQNRRHSTGELPPKRSVSQRQLQIGKAYDIVIQQSGNQKKQMGDGSPCKRRLENEGTIAFKKGSSIEKMMQKCKKQLQITKLKQLLSVENRYSKNQVSHLKYIEIIDKINQEHTSKLQEIQTKEGRLKNALGQLLQAYKGRFLQDDPQGTSHLDVSLSFDKWDFNSSAKKSIDHFDFPENNSSKVLSIESVLRELEEQDAGITSDEKRFKKNKSLQMIEAIAQRSKEISQKDVASFEQNLGSGGQAIRIKEPQESREHSQLELEQEDVQIKDSQNRQIFPLSVKAEQTSAYQHQRTPQKLKSLSQIRSEKHNEEFVSSQSLLITPAGVPELLVSEQDIKAAPSPQMIRQLIYKEIKTVPIDYSHPSVSKFRQLVIEKILMTNIKLINSIKFVFSKAGEQRKRIKRLEYEMPSIDTDINAINTWLLQISHFVLDSYQQVLRDNLHRVKQPPITDILAMARRGLSTIPTYQTIPEFIYKDFEFYFIKTLQKTYNVNNNNYEPFSTVVYTFHRALIDALNQALMEELATGKDWIRTPWKMPKKFKVLRESYDQVKLCLQRSINVVSNWGEYGLGRLVLDDDFSEAQYRQFQEEKIKLVCRQQILNEALNPSFSVGNVMLEIAEWVYQAQLHKALMQAASIEKSK